MKELSATQDSMEKSRRESETLANYMSQLLNVSRAIVFTVDQEYKLVTWNEAFAKTVVTLGVTPEKEMTAFEWRPEKERQHFVDLFKRVFNGETFETMEESRFDGNEHHLIAAYAPLRNKENEIVEAAVFAKDITPIVQMHGGSPNTARKQNHERNQLRNH